jgi:hypothetical protein
MIDRELQREAERAKMRWWQPSQAQQIPLDRRLTILDLNPPFDRPSGYVRIPR